MGVKDQLINKVFTDLQIPLSEPGKIEPTFDLPPTEPRATEPDPAEPKAVEPMTPDPKSVEPMTPEPTAPKEFNPADIESQIKALWDSYTNSGRNVSQSMRRLIRQMWLDAGGTTVSESKKKSLKSKKILK
jgi:hypothetical protein